MATIEDNQDSIEEHQENNLEKNSDNRGNRWIAPPHSTKRPAIGTVIWIVVVLLLVAVGVILYFWQNAQIEQLTADKATLQSQTNDLNKATAKTDTETKDNTNNTDDTSKQPATTVKSYTTNNLFAKCMSGKIDDTTDWGDSIVSKAYADFNSDGVEDVISYGTPPGTMIMARACVFTIKNDKITFLWQLQDLLDHSEVSVNSQNQIVDSGYEHESMTPVTNTYAWSTTSNTFVKQ